MELLIKLYDNKPSKIGIKYPHEYSAVKAYEDLLTKNAESLFLVRMEMLKNKLNLILECEQTGVKVLYKELDFKMDQLKRLQVHIKAGDALQFVHVYSKANTIIVAKPFRTSRFINVKSFEVIGPNNFENEL
jgi:hypothetical protein